MDCITQCTNKEEQTSGPYGICGTCKNQIDKNDGQPVYGYIIDRVNKGNEFRDPKGKPPVNYGNVMEKVEILLVQMQREKLQIKV